MAIGTSLFLIAVGAVLAFAVSAAVEGINVNAVGVILMVVGSIGLVLSLLFFASFAPYHRGHSHDEVVYRESGQRDVAPRDF